MRSLLHLLRAAITSFVQGFVWIIAAGLGFLCLVGFFIEQGRIKREADEAAKAAAIQAKENPPPTEEDQVRAFALWGLTLAEVERQHGKALTKHSSTGWAFWPRFKAHFINGRVDEYGPWTPVTAPKQEAH
jgi:hypothetical protein